MPVRASSPAKAKGSRLQAAFVAFAFLSGWALYAVPPARAKAEAALRPLLSAILPAPSAFRIADTHAKRGQVNGQSVLYVEGLLANIGADKRKSPTLRIALMGEDGRPVYSWKAKAVRPELAAGAETPFQTRLLAPPEKFRNIAISVDREG